MAESSREAARPHLILPIGTQVVSRVELRDSRGNVICPAGAVGEVIQAPLDGTHSYRVRLPDGREVAFQRQNLSIHKHTQRDDLAAAAADRIERELWDHVIYRCVIGSQAYGLAGEASDIDRRGFYLPPAELHWSLFGVPEQLENRETQETYWEIGKFLTMALKANPNVLECLATPLVETCAALAAELRENRSRFLSKLIYQTYNGYVLSQFRRLEQDLRTTGKLKWKHAMHLIRLLIAGIAGLETGEIPVAVDAELRDRLLAIRRGEVPWKEIDAWRLDLHRRFDAAFERTSLPERPDYAWANDFLIRARRSALPRA
ncbi:MAG TPA: nucleotidyltransferase domain-containing protein [Thermoanaerobaculia bacterium]|nr:nucleotidyltransferase domain-containing protein [Thermoanaerobaculia bacterium]